MNTNSFALYRLPGDDHYVELIQTVGDPQVLQSVEQLDGKQGFVLAPFAVSDDCPLLLLQPDSVSRLPLSEFPPDMVSDIPEDNVMFQEDNKETYSEDFRSFYTHIKEGEFDKLVLARRAVDHVRLAEEPRLLFLRACIFYPKMFVALVHTPVSGTWLTATPEILLEGGMGSYHTISLAGTMGFWGSTMWSDKNISEQHYVSSYIADCIKRFGCQCEQNGPYTVTAGSLRHLRSDFYFQLPDESRLGTFLRQLHPTPAVSGMPKEKSVRFICEHEHAGRRYYSGFMGPLSMQGETHLYVSLRCMQLFGTRYELYAGGGLLAESDERLEWKETEAKMQTMRRCYIKRMS